MKRVGIKTDDVNRVLVIEKLIIGDLGGLIAYLGNGFFVITEEATKKLHNGGVNFTEVKIIKGRPQSSSINLN